MQIVNLDVQDVLKVYTLDAWNVSLDITSRR